MPAAVNHQVRRLLLIRQGNRDVFQSFGKSRLRKDKAQQLRIVVEQHRPLQSGKRQVAGQIYGAL